MSRRNDPQDAVQRVLDRAVAEGVEDAIQVAAYFGGALVVDAWAAPAGRRVHGRTLFPVFSTGKGVAAGTKAEPRNASPAELARG